MADEQAKVNIVTVDAVTNLNELRETIANAKKALNEMSIGSEEYRQQLVELDKAQNLLKNAVNGTTATEEDYQKALAGTSKTYNTLVKQMADMKKELRNIDVSTEAGAKAFDDLAGRIASVNQELKDMDAKKGDFGRNVGDYFNQVTVPLKDIIKDLPSGLNAIKKPMDDVTKSLGLMGKQPILGILGLLAPLISQIATGIKENDGALKSVNKAMQALDPLMQFFENILDKVVNLVVDLIGKASAFISSNGIINKVIQGVMGVGNAILQFVIAPFKGIAAAIKVFQEEGVKGLGKAARAFGNEMKSGVSFKQNFQTGQAVADSILDGMSSRKTKAQKTGKDLAKETADAWEKVMQQRVKEYAEKVKARAEAEKYLKGLRDATQKDVDDATEAMNAELDAETNEIIARMQMEAEVERMIQEQSVKDAEEAAKKKVAAMNAYATGTADLLGAIADAFEANGELTEREEKRVKNLRIAAATINMLQGAVTAFSTAQELGPIAGPIAGAINAAAVIATGVANIAKIKATNVSRDSAPTTTTATPVSAPSIETAVPTTTVVNGARTEAALNNAAKPQKVYLVESEAQAMGNHVQVVEDETSF